MAGNNHAYILGYHESKEPRMNTRMNECRKSVTDIPDASDMFNALFAEIVGVVGQQEYVEQ
jgi:hypothetical protein